MKLTTTVRIITVIPIMAIIGLIGYEGYKEYQTYKETKPIKEKLIKKDTMKSLLDSINNEENLASIYLGSAGVSKEKELKNAFIETDKKILEVKKMLNDKEFLKEKRFSKKELTLLLDKMTDMRNKIINLDTDFNDIFFGFYNKISNVIFDLIKSQNIISHNPNIVVDNINYINTIKTITNVNKEKSFVSKTIEEYIPLTPEDIRKEEVLFSASKYIEPQGIFKKSIRTEIDKLSEEIKEIDKKLSVFKNDISYSVETGEFNIKRSEWEEIENKKIELLKSIESILHKDIIEEVDSTLDRQKITFLILLGTLLLALLFLLMSQKVSNALKRNIQNLSKIFKNMAEISGHEEEIDLDTAEGQKNAYEVIEDSISVLSESKDKAIKANESKSMFLANMSHEIRTPLNGIVGFTELLTHTELDEEQLEFVETIEKSSENLLSIINDILDLSKIESDKIEIEEIMFDPSFHFEQAAELYGAKAAEKNIDLSFFIDPILTKYNIKGDPTRLKEVIINLMSNAVKFTPKDGQIEVNIKSTGQTDNKIKVYFEVKDSGIGIEKDKLDLVFKAFSQADSSTTRKFGGTGLGLTISSKFVELMGGELQVKSDFGHGTTFFFEVEFETDKNPNKDYDSWFEGTNVSFLHSKKAKNQNQNIERYLEYIGINVNDCTSLNQVIETETIEKQHAILIDYDYVLERPKQEIEELTKITDKPLLLIIKPSLSKNEKTFKEMENVKYIFEPISLTKITKTCENIKEKLIYKEEEKVEEITAEETTVKRKKISSGKTNFKGRVLVAEDNIINQKLIIKTLEKFHLITDLADDGEKAVEARKDNEYDIIFMDINMPKMTGVEATQEILKWEEEDNVEHIPIVALTANAIKGDRERFIKAGMDEYITKPLKKADIEAIMKKFFGEVEFEEYLEKNKG